MEPSAVRLLRKDRQEYTFVCPSCGDFIVKAADRKIVSMLLGVGVTWSDEGAKHPELFDLNAPPLTVDDLLDFHRELEGL